MDTSEKPKDHLWWLEGLQSKKGGSMVQQWFNKNGVKRDTDNLLSTSLLHRMFERFLDKTARNETERFLAGKGEMPKDGMTWNGMEWENHATALIEYVEGSTVENMRSITFAELNKKSNRLARLLIKRLGMHIIILKH